MPGIYMMRELRNGMHRIHISTNLLVQERAPQSKNQRGETVMSPELASGH